MDTFSRGAEGKIAYIRGCRGKGFAGTGKKGGDVVIGIFARRGGGGGPRIMGFGNWQVLSESGNR